MTSEPIVDWRFTHDPELVKRAALFYKRSDYTHLPSLEEIANIRLSWWDDVNTMLVLMQYQEDRLGA